jgi:hypothetical protein
MSKRWILKCVPVLLVLLLAVPAFAGGAATIVLDELPPEIQAGQTYHLGFMVMQHGQRPVHYWEGVGPVEPRLIASNKETGEKFEVMAQIDKAKVGHFFVDVTFPSAGAWEWEIRPEPFELMNQLPPLTVLPAGAASVPVQAQPATAPATAPATIRNVAGIAGVALLLAAGLMLLRRSSRKPAQEPATVEAH